jgi:hypothetical protein
MENKILSSEEITQLLQAHRCEVTFTKVNGDLRVMPCTLRADVLPKKPVTEITENAKTKTPVPGVISAWCLDRQEWRSFRVNNVVSVVVIDDKLISQP